MYRLGLSAAYPRPTIYFKSLIRLEYSVLAEWCILHLQLILSWHNSKSLSFSLKKSNNYKILKDIKNLGNFF